MHVSKRTATLAVVALFALSVTTVGAVAWALTGNQHALAATASSVRALNGSVPARLTATPSLASLPAMKAGQSHSIADVAEHALPSVVNIATEKVMSSSTRGRYMPFRFPFGNPRAPRGHGRRMPMLRGQGSGVIVSADGIVLTNNHVVKGARSIKVTLADRREFTAKLVGADPKSDLAVLRLQGHVGHLTPIAFGNSDRLRLGEVVLAIGNPFGVGQTVTMGIVSAKGRTNVGIVDYEDFIQTDAAINPGNSGGALVTMDGRLVGINTAILSRSGGNQGIGFAIPARIAKYVMASLLANGKVRRGFLGVRIQTVTPDLSKAMGLHTPRGVLISDVEPGSAAARAGLHRGDVMVRVDGLTVDTAGRLRSIVANRSPGSPVKLVVKRGAKTLRMTVRLGTLSGGAVAGPPASPKAPSNATPNTLTLSGLTVTPITKDLRRKHKIPYAVRRGLFVSQVAPGSKAAQAGLQQGDVVLEVNRKDVTSLKRFKIYFKQSGSYVVLLVYRNGGTLYLAFQK